MFMLLGQIGLRNDDTSPCFVGRFLPRDRMCYFVAEIKHVRPSFSERPKWPPADARALPGGWALKAR
eukprot:8325682-Alexandrium_andersonii.AAC.1